MPWCVAAAPELSLLSSLHDAEPAARTHKQKVVNTPQSKELTFANSGSTGRSAVCEALMSMEETATTSRRSLARSFRRSRTAPRRAALPVRAGQLRRCGSTGEQNDLLFYFPSGCCNKQQFVASPGLQAMQRCAAGVRL